MKKVFKIEELEELLEGVRWTNERVYCDKCEGIGTYTMLERPYRKCPKCQGVGWFHNPDKIVLDEDVQFQITPSFLIESNTLANLIEMAKVSGNQEVTLSFNADTLHFDFVGGMRGRVKEAFWLYPGKVKKIDF